jgi:hypothetical protein
MGVGKEQTKTDIEKRIKTLDKEYQDTIDAECRYADQLSPEAFAEKKKLLIIKRQYLIGEKEEQIDKQAELETATLNRVTIDSLKKRLQRNLDTASESDWRFILETIRAKVLAFGDGSWDLSIDVPAIPENLDAGNTTTTRSETDLIVNTTPWCTVHNLRTQIINR